jgi:peptidoglycan/xylan/chitin deacetylase (PgdA/CDA1 family)
MDHLPHVVWPEVATSDVVSVLHQAHGAAHYACHGSSWHGLQMGTPNEFDTSSDGSHDCSYNIQSAKNYPITVAPANLSVHDMEDRAQRWPLKVADNKIAYRQRKARASKLRAEDELASILRKRRPTDARNGRQTDAGKSWSTSTQT